LSSSRLTPITARVAWVFQEENFDVDRIIGVANIKETDAKRLQELAMRDFDPAFSTRVAPGDVLVGGPNFGYGHPHMPPMQAMRLLGISAIVADSFAPAYWNSEISLGFPQVVCPGISRSCRAGDRIRIDFDALTVQLEQAQVLRITPYTERDRQVLACGSFVAYLAQRQRT